MKALSLFSNVGMAETYLEESGVEVVVDDLQGLCSLILSCYALPVVQCGDDERLLVLCAQRGEACTEAYKCYEYSFHIFFLGFEVGFVF